jgi:hypothetical protein
MWFDAPLTMKLELQKWSYPIPLRNRVRIHVSLPGDQGARGRSRFHTRHSPMGSFSHPGSFARENVFVHFGLNM